MVKNAKRHCNDAQNTKSHQYGYSAFGERQGFKNQASYSLPNGIVKSLDITGSSSLFAHRPMTLAW